MIRLIKRRADQVVHRRVRYHECLLAVAFDVEHAGEQSTRLRHNEPARFEQQSSFEPAQRAIDGASVLRHLGLSIESAAVVVDAQPSTGVDRAQHNCLLRKLAYQLIHAIERRAEWIRRADLRTDMNAHPVRLKPAIASPAPVNLRRLANINAELVLAQASGNVRVGVGEYVRIHTQRKPRTAFQLASARRKQVELGFALHIEFEDLRFKRAIDLFRSLAHSGEDHPACSLRRSSQNALQLAARDNVEPRTAVGEQFEDRECRIGLYGVAHQVLAARQRLLKNSEPLDNLIGRVDIKGCAVTPRQTFQRNFAAVQCVTAARVNKRA